MEKFIIVLLSIILITNWFVLPVFAWNSSRTEPSEITDENKDKVQMLYRRGKSGKTPVIINGKMKQTQYITLGIQRDKKDKEKYHVFAAYYGPCATNEPWDPKIESEEQRKECEEFWNTHALCLAPTQIDWKRSKEQEETV